MRYLRIQRNYKPMITIGEYIEATDPETYRRLAGIQSRKVIRDVTSTILAAGDVTGKDKYYEQLMKERPKPGRGGLLRNEKESVLYD